MLWLIYPSLILLSLFLAGYRYPEAVKADPIAHIVSCVLLGWAIAPIELGLILRDYMDRKRKCDDGAEDERGKT